MTYNPFGVFAWYQAKFFLAASALDVNGAGYCRLYCRNDGASDYFYYLDSAGNERKLVYVGGTGSDTNKVLVSATDTTPQYLYDKLTVTHGITITHSLGADEEVSFAGGKVEVSIDDTTPNYLLNKLAAGTGITLTETNPAGDEDVTIACTIPDLSAKSFVTVSAEGALSAERVLTAGNGISVTDGGAGTTVTIAAEWKDDGTGTLVPVTANDNVLVVSNDAGSAIQGNNTSLAGGVGVSGSSATGHAIFGDTAAGVDRTAEVYSVNATGRTHLGDFADIVEAAVPEDAPSGKVRIFAKTDGKPYSVDDAGNEYDLTAGAGSGFTAGMIMMWSGTIATIPAGWVLCDGGSGSPDLRNRFVVCADADDAGVAKTTITGGATQSGGSISYTPAGTNTGLAALTHAGTAVDTHVTSAVAAGTLAPRTFLAAPTAHTVTQPNDHAAHNHTFTGTAASIIPPYYALAYIMKT